MRSLAVYLLFVDLFYRAFEGTNSVKKRRHIFQLVFIRKSIKLIQTVML